MDTGLYCVRLNEVNKAMANHRDALSNVWQAFEV
jgi:hypothetical protein